MKPNTFDILKTAKQQKYAIGAFNAANIETLKAITNAAKKLNSPVLIEASEGEIEYIGKKQLAALVNIYRQELNIPIILNLDHGSSLESCKEAVDVGFDYVHFDGSKLPLTENIKIVSELVKYAHDKGIPVEGEIDHIEGSSADHTKESPLLLQKGDLYTRPERAYEFVMKTGVDVFAAFIGNLHGMYAEEMHLNLEILKELGQCLPNTYFSLHGGSGINDKEVQESIKLGIVKVNVNTEMRLAFKTALQKSLNESDEIAVYKLTPPAIKAVEEVVERKIKLFKV